MVLCRILHSDQQTLPGIYDGCRRSRSAALSSSQILCKGIFAASEKDMRFFYRNHQRTCPAFAGLHNVRPPLNVQCCTFHSSGVRGCIFAHCFKNLRSFAFSFFISPRGMPVCVVGICSICLYMSLYCNIPRCMIITSVSQYDRLSSVSLLLGLYIAW